MEIGSLSPMCAVALERVEHELRGIGSGLQPPAVRDALSELWNRGITELQVRMPRDYLAFLHATDGLDWNGLTIFASSPALILGFRDRWIGGCVEMNLLHRDVPRRAPHLLLAQSGDEHCVYDADAERFLTCDRVSGDVLESYAAFGQMLRALLRRH